MVIIGLSPNVDTKNDRDCMPPDYISAVLRAGALPLILPMLPAGEGADPGALEAAVALVDGMVFTGGPDIHPRHYGETMLPGCHIPLPERDSVDLALMRLMIAAGKPFLGICRGLQVCNTAMGGSLYQDLPSQVEALLRHQAPNEPRAHSVTPGPGSLLARLCGEKPFEVTSRHHQAIKELAPGLLVSGRSPDGVIEAVEFEDGRPALCVQWHPENLAGDDSRQQALFDWLVREAGANR